MDIAETLSASMVVRSWSRTVSMSSADPDGYVALLRKPRNKKNVAPNISAENQFCWQQQDLKEARS